MNDIDFDELLDCAEENIENSAFFASSTQVLSILDNTILAIDERLSKKRSSIVPASGTLHSGLHGRKRANPTTTKVAEGRGNNAFGAQRNAVYVRN